MGRLLTLRPKQLWAKAATTIAPARGGERSKKPPTKFAVLSAREQSLWNYIFRAVEQYHFFCLGPAGEILFSHWIEAETDSQAIQRVRQFKIDSAHCELWLRNRLVASLPPD
jgi:hypothetical protein